MGQKIATERARRLRDAPTDAEARLCSRLRAGQLASAKFVRQLPIGPYVTDFACRSAKLVVELDGGQHASRAEQDAQRSHLIEAHGYTVIRFWNNDVLGNTDGVLEAISQELANARSRQT